MDSGTAASRKPNGLKTAFDTIVSPREAFESLRVTPTWGLALAASIIMYAAASILVVPAAIHATQASWPQLVAQNPRLAAETPAQQQQMLDLTVKIVQWSWIFTVIVVPIFLLIQTLILTLFEVLGRGDRGFGTLWAVSCNLAVVTGLGVLCNAAIVLIRGADAFTNAFDVQTAVPSLGMLAPSAPLRLHAFLSLFTPFSIWVCGLTIFAMMVAARVSKPVAWIAGLTILIVAAALGSLGAR
jgi:hypothetical protein